MQLAEPDAELERGEILVRLFARREFRRIREVEIRDVALDVEREPGADDCDGPPDESDDVLVAEARVGVDGPERRVDRAQHRREGRFGFRLRGLAFALCGVGRDHACRDVSDDLLLRSEAFERTGVGGKGASRRGFPRDAAAEGFVEQLSDRRARDVEHFEGFVDVVGQQEPGDGIDGLRGIDLVEARLGGVGGLAGGVDEAEQPATRNVEARPHAQRR